MTAPLVIRASDFVRRLGSRRGACQTFLRPRRFPPYFARSMRDSNRYLRLQSTQGSERENLRAFGRRTWTLTRDC